MTVKEAIEVLKDAKYIGSDEYASDYDREMNGAIDTVIAELEKPLPTDEKTVCPECLKKCTNEELRMFGGLCEECSTDFN